MSRIKRRQFLQFAGSALFTLGLSQLELEQRSLRYAKVLAQSTPRKLALLVGINKYPNSPRFSNLQGCTTDVDLQNYLLIHRFGFNPNDIVRLTDGQATRKGILDAFEEHLVKQAGPGDVVVFHFSGHGSYVVDPNPIDETGLNSTFVPADDNPSAPEGIVNDITGQSLFLLMYALKQKTENVTAVLDSCHSGGGTRGNIRVRSIPGGDQLNASPAEFEYHQKWLNRHNLPRDKFQELRKQGVATGIVIASAQREQLAVDYKFPGFSAGGFTYLLTQYLWQKTDAVSTVIESVGRELKTSLYVYGQEPLVDALPNSGNKQKPVYFLEKPTPPAEAVITQVTNNQVTLWLGGIDPDSLDAFGEDAMFTSVTANTRGGVPAQVKISSRQGLTAQATVEGTVQPGMLLQEFARAIPSEWQLKIGLDPSLGSEATQAQQVVQRLNRTKAIASQSGGETYPESVNYILTRLNPTYRQILQRNKVTEIPPEGSIGLLSPTLELIPKSFAMAGESVEDAVSRLRPKLKSLLAAHIVKMTLNSNASRLDLAVTMGLEDGSQAIADAFTPRGCKTQGSCLPSGRRGGPTSLSNRLPVNAPFQFRVENRENKDLYLGILLIDPAEGISVLFPNEYQDVPSKELDQATLIKAQQTLLIPDPAKDPFELVTEEPGVGEVLIIASTNPLSQSLSRLRRLASERGNSRGPLSLEEPVEVINDLITDISSRGLARPRARQQPVSSSEMAALSITFEVMGKS